MNCVRVRYYQSIPYAYKLSYLDSVSELAIANMLPQTATFGQPFNKFYSGKRNIGLLGLHKLALHDTRVRGMIYL